MAPPHILISSKRIDRPVSAKQCTVWYFDEQYPTHAHINLIGFVLSLSHGIIRKLWLANANQITANIQFIVHHAGALTIFFGLFLLYGNFASEEKLDPVLAIGSITVLSAALLMFCMALKAGPAKGCKMYPIPPDNAAP